jgi:terminal uridylyltransferase
MILSNVRIADAAPAESSERRGPSHRGRGGFHHQHHHHAGGNRFLANNGPGPFSRAEALPVVPDDHASPLTSPHHSHHRNGDVRANRHGNHFGHAHGTVHGDRYGNPRGDHHGKFGGGHRQPHQAQATQPGRDQGFNQPNSRHQMVVSGPDGAQPQIDSRHSAPFLNGHHMKPHGRPAPPPMAAFIAQCEYLDQLAAIEIAQVEMGIEELSSKEALRDKLERTCQAAMKAAYPDMQCTIHLQCYGSLVSGFATKGSDVDMTINWSGPNPEDDQFLAEMPRVLERAILEAGHGARLLERTRVPILKICENPNEELFQALKAERQKWEELSEDEKYPALATPSVIQQPEAKVGSSNTDVVNSELHDAHEMDPDASRSGKAMESPALKPKIYTVAFLEQLKSTEHTEHNDLQKYCRQFIDSATNLLRDRQIDEYTACQYFLEGMSPNLRVEVTTTCRLDPQNHATFSYNNICEAALNALTKVTSPSKPWLRERARGPLDFPKSGVGIQCDINFSNPLGIHNTRLLRCYSRCDNRVRPMVLFVKAWAKRRKINSAYSGTLSSYGYVLMVLHFLANVARPPVVPNLQQAFGASQGEVLVNGYNISFFDDEQRLQELSDKRLLTQNSEPLGVLLRNFFHYFAAQGSLVAGGGYNWMKDVISLRTPSGILSKEGKGWTGAKTVMRNNVSYEIIQGGNEANSSQQEVRQRYLFAIEDPFELDHNVARPVTHNGIVTIRDEFRRAWRILLCIGSGKQPEGELFAHLEESAPLPKQGNPVAAAPQAGKTPDDVLPGLVDLSLRNGDHQSDPIANLQPLMTAVVPPHLQTRNVGDIRPPPGF